MIMIMIVKIMIMINMMMMMTINMKMMLMMLIPGVGSPAKRHVALDVEFAPSFVDNKVF